MWTNHTRRRWFGASRASPSCPLAVQHRRGTASCAGVRHHHCWNVPSCLQYIPHPPTHALLARTPLRTPSVSPSVHLFASSQQGEGSDEVNEVPKGAGPQGEGGRGGTTGAWHQRGVAPPARHTSQPLWQQSSSGKGTTAGVPSEGMCCAMRKSWCRGCLPACRHVPTRPRRPPWPAWPHLTSPGVTPGGHHPVPCCT